MHTQNLTNRLTDGYFSNSFLDRLPRMQLGQGLLAEFQHGSALAAKTQMARKALQLAEDFGSPQIVNESRCVLAAFNLLHALRELSLSRDAAEATKVPHVASALAMIDTATKMLTGSLYRWGMKVNPVSRNALPSRFRDSVNFASRLASAVREIGKSLRIPDPHPNYRLQPLSSWNESELSGTGRSVLWVEATHMLKDAGEYDLTFQFTKGMVGLDIHSIQLLQGTSPTDANLIDSEAWEFHVGRWDRWVEYWLTLPSTVLNLEKSDGRLFLKAEVSLPAAAHASSIRTSQGKILIRRSWRDSSDIY